jgi:hypothetical protein
MEVPMRITFAQRSLFLAIFAVVATGTAFATVGVASLAHQHQHRGRSMGDPVVVLEGVVRQIARNDYATAWQTLEPAQQLLVPEREYVRCESASPIPGHLASIQVLRSFEEPVAVAGSGSGAVETRAVTFRLKISEPGLSSVIVTHTVHAVHAGRRWAWILPAKRLELHRSGTCGARPAGAPE